MAGADRLLRLLFAGVVLASTGTGLALLMVPGSASRYFSWPLTPAPLAALVGGFYLASAVTFAIGLRAHWPETQPLALGVFGLAIPTFVVTMIHLEAFDFGRWQAWLWVALFGGFPSLMAAILYTRSRTASPSGRGLALATWARAALVLVGMGFLTIAVVLWADPIGAAWLPFDPPELGGRFLGCWSSFLATLSLFAAIRGRREDGWIPTAALIAYPAGALVATLRSLGDLGPHGRVPFIVASGLVLCAGVALRVGARARH